MQKLQEESVEGSGCDALIWYPGDLGRFPASAYGFMHKAAAPSTLPCTSRSYNDSHYGLNNAYSWEMDCGSVPIVIHLMLTA